MTEQTKRQKEIIGRVMHEFKHGELETGTGKKVKDPRQAIAIGLHEAGASKYESTAKNKRNLERTKEKERKGQTAMQQKRRQKNSLTERRVRGEQLTN